MIELEYSLIIEATGDPEFFGFYSPDLEGFTGIGHSIGEGARVKPSKFILKENARNGR